MINLSTLSYEQGDNAAAVLVAPSSEAGNEIALYVVGTICHRSSGFEAAREYKAPG